MNLTIGELKNGLKPNHNTVASYVGSPHNAMHSPSLSLAVPDSKIRIWGISIQKSLPIGM